MTFSMKKVLVVILMLTGVVAQAKLTDQQSMKCIDSDRKTKSAFQDLQAAYEMRLLTAKDFFKVMEKPASCPQLKKDLSKLHASAVATFPKAKSATRFDANSSNLGPVAPEMPSFNGDFPAPPDFGSDFPAPPMPDGDFSEDDSIDF